MNNSMINPSVVDLLKKVEDRYSLVIVTSRRAMTNNKMELYH